MRILQPLHREFRAEGRHSGDIPARLREASNNACGDGVADRRSNDGDRLHCSLGRKCPRRAMSDEDVDLETIKLGRKFWEPIVVPLGPAKFNNSVLTANISEIA